MKFLNVDNVKQVFRLEKFDYPVFHEILAKLIWNIFIVVGIRWRTQSCHNLWERGAAPPSLPVSSVTKNGSNSYFLVNTLFDVLQNIRVMFKIHLKFQSLFHSTLRKWQRRSVNQNSSHIKKKGCSMNRRLRQVCYVSFENFEFYEFIQVFCMNKLHF